MTGAVLSSGDPLVSNTDVVQAHLEPTPCYPILPLGKFACPLLYSIRAHSSPLGHYHSMNNGLEVMSLYVSSNSLEMRSFGQVSSMERIR